MKNNSEIKESFDFKNLALVAKRTEVKFDQVSLNTKLTRNINMALPLVSAASDKITESAMAVEMARLGGVGVIHCNMTLEKQASEVLKVKQADAAAFPDATKDEQGNLVAAALIRQSTDSFDRAVVLADNGLDVLVLEGNHLNTKDVAETVKNLRRNRPGLQIIAGNIFNADDVRLLTDSGVDGLKLGGRKQILDKLGVDVLNFQMMIDIISEASVSLTPVMLDDEVNDEPLLSKILGAGFSSVVLKDVLVTPNPSEVIKNMVTSLKATIAYTGNETLKSFAENVEFSRII